MDGYSRDFSDGRDEAADKLAGLGLGADDYIAKPFLPQEFLLRIHAVLRRCYKEDVPVLKLDKAVLTLQRPLSLYGSTGIQSVLP